MKEGERREEIERWGGREGGREREREREQYNNIYYDPFTTTLNKYTQLAHTHQRATPN